MIAVLRALLARAQAFAVAWPACIGLATVWTLVVALLVIRGGPLL